MEKLTNDQMENLVGGIGSDCFALAALQSTLGYVYLNDPTPQNRDLWLASWALFLNCASM